MAGFNLVCGICQREKGVDALCHHCSKPLCAEHRILWPDNAFDGNPGAIHCLDCLLKHHLRMGPLLNPLIRALWSNSLTFQTLLQRGNGLS